MLSSSTTAAFSSSSSDAEELTSSSSTEEIIYYCPFHKGLFIPCSICGWKIPVGKLEQITHSSPLINDERIWRTTCGAIKFRTLTYGSKKFILTGGWLFSSVESWFRKRRIRYIKIQKNRGKWIVKKK